MTTGREPRIGSWLVKVETTRTRLVLAQYRGYLRPLFVAGGEGFWRPLVPPGGSARADASNMSKAVLTIRPVDMTAANATDVVLRIMGNLLRGERLTPRRLKSNRSTISVLVERKWGASAKRSRRACTPRLPFRGSSDNSNSRDGRRADADRESAGRGKSDTNDNQSRPSDSSRPAR